MKRLSTKWRLFLRRLLIICSSGFLTAGACTESLDMYGMPPVMYGTPPVSSAGSVTATAVIDGRVLAADTHIAIPGIRVIIAGSEHQRITGARGYFAFYFHGEQATNAESGTLLFQDVDGAQNGEFYDATVSWDQDTMLPYDIYMQRKDEGVENETTLH
jgi:hypothetical protein